MSKALDVAKNIFLDNKGLGVNDVENTLVDTSDIEEDNSNLNNQHDNADDDKFNTEKHHKKQHKF